MTHSFPTRRASELWSGNWEDMLGGEFEKRSHDYNFEGIEKEIFGHFEKTFMMYLPRLCEHCLNPSCLASCPSGALYKREEDGIVLIDQEKCRGLRMRSEEHTSELQSLMRISYAVSCFEQKTTRI